MSRASIVGSASIVRRSSPWVRTATSLAAYAVALVCALALTACSSVRPPEVTAPSPSAAQAEVTPRAAQPEVTPGSAQPEAASAAGRSVLDGVFTARQASRGDTRFQQVCAACHSISEFRGGRFRLVWVGRTVGELFQTVSTLMPEDDPGSLSAKEYSAIISYMLRENGYPAGEQELATDAPTLQDIRIVVGAA